jgi:hypothetical protein
LKQLQRIEHTWQSLIDCLVVYNLDIPHRNRELLKHLCRKLFSVGAFNLDFAISELKDFMFSIYQDGSRLITRDRLSINRNSIFWPLLLLEGFEYLPNDKLSFERLAASTLTRGFPPSSDQTKSLQKFKDLVVDDFKSSPDLLASFAFEANRLGSYVKRHMPSNAVWHFSVNASGSLLSSVSEGGKVKEMLDDIKPILLAVPSTTYSIDSPFGLIQFRSGYPNWTSWFRTEEESMVLSLFEFPGPSIEIDEFGIKGIRGYDSSFALQVFYIAYSFVLDLFNSDLPMEVRVVSVPEPGGKVRTVSMGPWWSQVYLAPFGHFFQECLRGDFDGAPCLYRGSLAWDAFFSMRNVHDRNGMMFMSSDMTSCTDAFPKDLAFTLLSSFIEGMGVTGDLLRLAVIHSVGLRSADVLGDPIVMRRGVLMGEPVTKSLLTLYMVCLRAYSLRSRLGEFDPDNLPGWWFFHIGGDDHLVHGPPDYLDSVMNLVIESGFLLDTKRQGYSDFGLRYLQVPFYFHNVDLKDPKAVFDEERYHLSAYCDHVKSRLLSPNVKPHSASQMLNVSIGKAISLGENLSYLRPSLKSYALGIRNRFLWRMEALLPSRITANSLFQTILLPQFLGGLGLALSDEERLYALEHSPKPTRVLVSRLLDGVARPFEIHMFKRMNLNTKYFIPTEEYRRLDELLSYGLPDYDSSVLKTLKVPYLHAIHELELNGIYSLDNLMKRILRLQCNLEVLQAKKPLIEIPWTKKYWLLWGQYLDDLKLDDYPISQPQSWSEVTSAYDLLGYSTLKDTNTWIDPEHVILLKQETHPLIDELGLFYDEYQPIFMSFYEAIEYVLPALKVEIPVRVPEGDSP